ncbi:MAG: S8 family serine peptidase, partial [Bacteroidia bacterium]|nr:S8 family serine peptidase [Bacteroidia bacterium]
QTIRKLPFVKDVSYVGKSNLIGEEEVVSDRSIENQLRQLAQTFEKEDTSKSDNRLGKSYDQMHQISSDFLYQRGWQGKGVRVAVLDAGFNNLDKLPAFKHLFDEQRIISTWDFVEAEEEVFEDDEHGLAVMSCLAAQSPENIVGGAPKSEYILLRTENPSSEYLVEEYFWLFAAEYADSAGVDIINSSLGYSKHDEKSMGHKFSELDGKTTVVTKAAEIASSKGILIVASAGNEGNDPWRKITAPSDGELVLSVGAVDKKGNQVSFSSVGPTADKRIKPDVVARGKNTNLLAANGRTFEGNGTSYACPIISASAAQLLQLAPKSSAQKLKEVIVLSANNYHAPNKQIGCGLPNLELASQMILVNKDSIIKVFFNDEKNLDIIVFSGAKQKVKISIEDSLGEIVERQNYSFSKGLNRIEMRLNKKRASGLYQLRVELPSKTLKAECIKP